MNFLRDINMEIDHMFLNEASMDLTGYSGEKIEDLNALRDVNELLATRL